MKKLMIVLFAAILLIGCSSGSEDGKSSDQVEIDVMMFEGGFGSDWVKESAEKYMEEHPNVKINLQASPDIHQQLQPRFLSNDGPDLFNPGPKFDIMGLIDDGQVLELDEYLQAEAYNSDEKWINTFEETQFNLKYNDQVVGIPIVSPAGRMWWYNQKLFNDNNWELPETWEDFYELRDKAQEKDIAVFAIPGKAPDYFFYGYYLPMVQRIGGTEAILDAFNLKENAWNSDAFLKAAEETVKMMDEGLFMDGTMALSHTEAQTLFFQDKALFVTAGTWLEGEMQDVIPDDFELRAFNNPVWEDNVDNKDIPVATGWGGGWYVYEQSENVEETIDFLKFLTSQEEVSNMVKARGLGSVVKGTDDAVESEALRSAFDQMKTAEKSFAPSAINDSYPEFATNVINEYQSLLLGESTPEEFVQRAEELAASLKADDSVKKVEFNWN